MQLREACVKAGDTLRAIAKHPFGTVARTLSFALESANYAE